MKLSEGQIDGITELVAANFRCFAGGRAGVFAFAAMVPVAEVVHFVANCIEEAHPRDSWTSDPNVPTPAEVTG